MNACHWDNRSLGITLSCTMFVPKKVLKKHVIHEIGIWISQTCYSWNRHSNFTSFFLWKKLRRQVWGSHCPARGFCKCVFVPNKFKTWYSSNRHSNFTSCFFKFIYLYHLRTYLILHFCKASSEPWQSIRSVIFLDSSTGPWTNPCVVDLTPLANPNCLQTKIASSSFHSSSQTNPHSLW